MDPHKAISQYIHETWSIEKGLEQKDIYAIIQSRDQYLWLGTSEGLLRFDGHHFRLFNKSNVEKLGQSFISTFCESRNGGLWIGTYGGGLLRLRDGRFSVWTTADGLASDLIRAVCEARDGSVWIGTFGGIDRYLNGRFVHYSTREGLSSNNVKALCEDRNGTLWAGTANGLNRMQGTRFVDVPIIDAAGKSAPWFVNEIRESRNGGLLIGLHGGGLRWLKNGVFKSYTTREGLSSNYILSIIEDGDGNLWLGTMGGGINRFFAGKFSVFSTNDGLTNSSVFCLYEDRDGSIWAGTTGNGGLNRLRDGRFLAYSSRDGLPDNQVWSVAQARDGAIWIGGQSGVCRWDKGAVLSADPGRPAAKWIVRSLFAGRDGSMWIGTEGSGLIHWRDGKLRAYTTKQGLSHDIVWSLWEDLRGDLWVGTDDGLSRIHRGVISRFSQENGLPSTVIRAIYETANGDIWLGTNGGLVRYRDGEFKLFTTRDGLSLNMVRSISEDREGALWIGTLGGGLNRFKDGRFTSITTKEGLAADEIWSIHEDRLGYLWMSCNRGIFRVRWQDLTDFRLGKRGRVHCDFYGNSEGLMNGCLGGSTPAGCRARDGRIWFPTQNGVVAVDPTHILVNRMIPPVLIERVIINNSEYAVGETITAPPGRGNLEFQYTALSFINSAAVSFKYRLEGFESEWNEAENRRSAYYTNIPPGKYRFRVIASNNEGIWNEKGATLSFNLRPHFYQTLWFYSLVLLAGIGLVAGIIRMRLRRLKARERELTVLVDERTEQLQHANDELAAMNIELERLTLTDRLTDVANRRGFENTLHKEWLRCQREKKHLSLVMIDIDFFKNYNDALGHLKGDECLRQVASLLNACAQRPGDMVARYGGEEFVALLPSTDTEGAATLAEHIRTSVERLAIAHPDSRVGPMLTISLGVSTVIPDAHSSQEMLIAAADRMLYQTKKEGRNRVAVMNMSS